MRGGSGDRSKLAGDTLEPDHKFPASKTLQCPAQKERRRICRRSDQSDGLGNSQPVQPVGPPMPMPPPRLLGGLVDSSRFCAAFFLS